MIVRLKSNNILLLATITDDNGKLVLANMLAREIQRNNIVQSLKSLVLKHNYDGIDLLSKNKGKLTRNEPQFRVNMTQGTFSIPSWK